MMREPLNRWAAAMVAGVTFAGSAFAVDPPAVPVRSGGVSVDEFAELNRHASDYSLKLVLAAKRSGAYLADVDVVVRSLPSRQVVLEHRSEGPLVLAALPAGRYEVTASYGRVLPGAPTVNTRVVTIPRSGLAQMVMYFDTGDEVSANSPPEFSTR